MVTQFDDIAWIGVGKMGLPIVGRIFDAGYRVTVYDASADRVAAARQRGLAVAASAIEAVAGKAVVLASLPDDNALRSVLLAKGFLAALAPGSILVETSTVSAEISRQTSTRSNTYDCPCPETPASPIREH
jgi:3-hydroxyisobutyrate dehydrogenase-like beta-hydroxyacid dehydrogenase